MSELLKAFVSDLRQEDRKMSLGRTPAGMQPRLEWIDIEEIDSGSIQARTFSSPEETEALRRSVAQNGILQPLVVRQTPDGSRRYEVVAGHRRLEAATHARRSPVPCIVRQLDDQEAHLVMVAENVIREDLHPVDEAFAYRELIEKGYVGSQGEIAELMGVSRTRVNRKIQLAGLHPEILEHVRKHRPESIREGHLEELMKVKAPEQQLQLYHRAVEEKLTVGVLRRIQRSNVQRGSAAKKNGKHAKNGKNAKIYRFPEGEIHLSPKTLQFRPAAGFDASLEPELLLAPLEKLVIRLKRECASYEKRFIERARVPATPTPNS